MGNARALIYSHHDEEYEHVHIVGSKINPDTLYAYDLAGSWRKLSLWAEQYEREYGGLVNERRAGANELRRAIKERDAEGVLEALTRQRSTFTAKELERAIQKEIYSSIGAEAGVKRSVALERAQFANTVLAHADVVRLADRFDGPVTRYTTRAVLEAETYVLRAASGLKENTSHAIDSRVELLAGSKYSGMSPEQIAAFGHATGAEGLALIDGQAGTGKSFTMVAIRDAYEQAGCRVIGLAFTNKVATAMGEDGFAEARTIHRELTALNNGRSRWDGKTVVMVDEAAMVDTRLMAMLTAHANDAGAKLILCGDDRQLSSIDFGGMFGVLKDRHGAAVLSEVRRQYKVDDRRASEMMAEGNYDGALGIYDRKGAIHWTLTQEEARERLVEKWASDTAADPSKSRFGFAFTNDDVNQLNAALRAVHKDRGELEGQDHRISTAHGRFEFSAGDRIQFTGTDKRLGIDNGDTGTIEAIKSAETRGTRIAVRLDGRNRRIIEIDAASFGQFRHGYAGAIHKGQGATLASTYLYHSEHWRNAPTYVALTRHREDVAIFVARNVAKNVTELAKQVARQDETRAASMFHQQNLIGPVRPMTAREILERFADNHFVRTAHRMERDGQTWPSHERTLRNQPSIRPKPPWPTAREQRRPYQGIKDKGSGPMNDWWDEETRERRMKAGGGPLFEEKPARENDQADQPRPRQPQMIYDRPPPDRTAIRAAEILAQVSNPQASYDMKPWQGGYAVFRIWNTDNEDVAALELQAPQQKLGKVRTLAETHAAIIDGTAFSAAPEWVSDREMERQAKAAPNRNNRDAAVQQPNIENGQQQAATDRAVKPDEAAERNPDPAGTLNKAPAAAESGEGERPAAGRERNDELTMRDAAPGQPSGSVNRMAVNYLDTCFNAFDPDVRANGEWPEIPKSLTLPEPGNDAERKALKAYLDTLEEMRGARPEIRFEARTDLKAVHGNNARDLFRQDPGYLSDEVPQSRLSVPDSANEGFQRRPADRGPEPGNVKGLRETPEPLGKQMPPAGPLGEHFRTFKEALTQQQEASADQTKDAIPPLETAHQHVAGHREIEPMTIEAIRADNWSAVDMAIPENAEPLLLNNASFAAMRCFEQWQAPEGVTQEQWEERRAAAGERVKELGDRIENLLDTRDPDQWGGLERDDLNAASITPIRCAHGRLRLSPPTRSRLMHGQPFISPFRKMRALNCSPRPRTWRVSLSSARRATARLPAPWSNNRRTRRRRTSRPASALPSWASGCCRPSAWRSSRGQ
jgi:Ti-type conjugative transfer relaxase TraA